jgi:hypothetical protein
MTGPQTCLQALLIMAYNVGRDHGHTNAMTLQEGRAVVSQKLSELVSGRDIGVLSEPVTSVLRLMAEEPELEPTN